jgi:glycosyltransferase involved in cell wall biosynthesis
MKILVISQALGEPGHKRGIFHFTRELIRSLAAEGHELTLLVETTPRYRRLRSRQRRTRLFPADSRIIELLALYRFLDEADMNAVATRSAPRRLVGWIVARVRSCTSREFGICLLKAIGLLPARIKRIENKTAAFEYVPTELRHLALFRSFHLEAGFYSYQNASAFTRLPPPQVDARGYDLILVDTPTRVAIRRGPDAKVVCVVHDLLPLTDLKLSDVATRLFMSRLMTSLSQADELAFVSNYSMKRFKDLLPQFSHLPTRVVYPRTRFEAVQPRPIPEVATHPGQPTFVVIVSAEPRKNLGGLIRAFRKLPQASLVVVGVVGSTGLVRNLPPNVSLAGYIDEHDKAALIANAHGLIMPSFAEGFGVPIIEALAANTPVLCSDIPVFREVAGELADYFDPFSAGSICASVVRVIAGQEELRRKIWEQRRELAERFGHQTQARDFFASSRLPELTPPSVVAMPAAL